MVGNNKGSFAYPKTMRNNMAEINLRELNALMKDPRAAILASEKEYHEKVDSVADLVFDNKNIKVVLLAGPSGSGKTTTANLIADAIKRRGEEAMVVSLDDFYLSAADPEYPRLSNGDPDYECPEALDLSYLSKTIENITENLPFSIPKYDFKVGKRVSVKEYSEAYHGCVIIEGLHALNPRIANGLDRNKILRLFVSVSTNISSDGERILSGRKVRFVRRLVRDSIYRGAMAERTLAMWKGVLAAEDIYLYPYKQTADLAFNTFHNFELSVMKSFATALISRSLADADSYAGTVLSALEQIVSVDHSLVPDNSLIREFIPGGIYESLY